MTRGRHRRVSPGSFSRVLSTLAVMALAAISLSGCEGAGVAGTVERQVPVEGPEGTAWMLYIRTAQGKLKEVRLPFAPWDRCTPGEEYPYCKQPPSFKAEMERTDD